MAQRREPTGRCEVIAPTGAIPGAESTRDTAHVAVPTVPSVPLHEGLVKVEHN